MYFTIMKHMKNSEGTVKLQNPNLENMSDDHLYHIGLGTGSHDLPKMFGDVKVRKIKFTI